jgi:hypothetical protein
MLEKMGKFKVRLFKLKKYICKMQKYKEISP